ncbi:hypothetical protein B0H11DRAFT_2058550 [Mycena galericulata]|nr:hypothetical protein B0H11DRAFT_2058550 [Mycena galericulata]
MPYLSDAQIFNQLFISRSLVFIPFTILLYDYALTIGQEVERYWGNSLTWGGGLYYLNRYSTIIGTIPVFVEYLLTTDDPGKDSFNLLLAAILITRTYALYERNKIVLGVMALITLGGAGFALVSTPADDVDLRTAGAWSSMLLFDVMIFALTVFKARRYIRRSNAFNIGTYVKGGVGANLFRLPPFLSGALSTVTNVLSSVLVSRLMLNLRDPTIRLPQRTRSVRVTATTTTREPFASGSRARPDLTDIALELDSVWEDQTHGMDGEDEYARI